jgi:signal transduction histidine kinase
MFLIVKEALHNAVKHSCATELAVKIDTTDDTAEIQVSDNGKGFNPALLPTGGNGLTNMKSRAESLGGTLAIESPGGRGTMICLKFPMAALREGQ